LDAFHTSQNIKSLFEVLILPKKSKPSPHKSIPFASEIIAMVSKDAYLKNIKRIKEHIQLGDIYEMNYCIEFFGKLNQEVNQTDIYQKTLDDIYKLSNEYKEFRNLITGFKSYQKTLHLPDDLKITDFYFSGLPNLYFKDLTANQMIFTSHIAFADTFKTIVLSMDDFEITEYDKTANGIILDENEESLLGFVSQNEEHFTVQMIDNTKYEFEIKYGNPACDFILKDNLLYIANYHPIATGSSLHCFNLNTKKMKWTADVKQINADHSEYSNKVVLSMYKDKIIMEGDEANGDYVQIFDCETGNRLAVFGDFLEIPE
jgi:hypothetical protein